MTDPVRIAVIGCGRVAAHYVQILNSGAVTGWRIVACCDPDKEKVARFAGHFGAHAFADMESMLAEVEADLVLVLTPSGMHYGHAKRTLELGFHTLVEKPLALVPEQGWELARLAEGKGLMYGVVFQNRYNPAIRCLKHALDANRFGKRVTATIRLRWCRFQDYYEDGWHGTWAQDGGVINQQAIHHVDALGWLCGPIEAVCAAVANRLNRLEAEDTMVAAVKFADGSLGTIEATTAARPEDFEASLSVVGELGMAQIGGIALNEVQIWNFLDGKDDADAVRTQHSQAVPTGYGLSHGPFLQDVVDALRAGKTAPPILADDSLQAVLLVQALYASVEQGGWVNLSDAPRSAKLGKSR
jgi:UDP-N-acetyl-2-amino-2-deoxyglucuronate dehydrogenase